MDEPEQQFLLYFPDEEPAKFKDHEFHLHAVELQNTGPSHTTALAAFVSFCSIIHAPNTKACISSIFPKRPI